MAEVRAKRSLLPRLGAGIAAIALIVGFVWFVRIMMASKTSKPDRQVQIVQLIRPPPPPPPPDQPPPPPPEKTQESLPKDEPEPTPNEEPPPAEPMGIDAQGSAEKTRLDLPHAHGGSDLIGGNGKAIFAWYTNRLKDAVQERLAADSQIGTKRFSCSVRVWLEADGRIKQVKLATTSGDRALDQRIESDLSSLARLSDSPPLEMPQPITMKIASRS